METKEQIKAGAEQAKAKVEERAKIEARERAKVEAE
jgi:hypothetical protein